MRNLSPSHVSFDNLVCFSGRGFKFYYIKLSVLTKVLRKFKWRVVKRKGREKVDHVEPI